VNPETNPKRILVGVDEEGLSDDAVQMGIALAKRFGAELTLCHAVPVPDAALVETTVIDWGPFREELMGAARKRCLERLHAKVGAEVGELGTVEHLLTVTQGKPSQVLLEEAQRHSADLLVLGAHARHGVVDFGGTARGVLHRSTCPVWMQPVPVGEIRRILVPVDLAETTEHTLAWARAVAVATGARITLFHAFADPFFAFEPLRSQPQPYSAADVRDAVKRRFEGLTRSFDWGDCKVDTRFVEAGDAVAAIGEVEEAFDAIVMGTHGRSALARVFLGSVAYGVLKHSRRPVLAVPMPHAE